MQREGSGVPAGPALHRSAAIGCAPIDLPAAGARLWAEWTADGLTRLAWAEPGASAAETLGAGHAEERPLPEPYASTLAGFFAGEDVDPVTLPVRPSGTPFQLKVWQALRAIPRGQVRSYAAIAAAIGSPRAMRAVGGANGKNPIAIVVPCHRVVEADMRLGGYSGGLHRKRFLLELEGARVVQDWVQPGQLELL